MTILQNAAKAADAAKSTPQTTSLPPRPTTFQRLAIEAVKQTGGLTADAARLMIEWLDNDKSLLAEVISDAINEAVRQSVRNVNFQARQNIVRQADANGRARVRALAAGIATSLLDFPLHGGVKLRDANREQLREAIRFYEKQAGENARRAAWLTKVLKNVPAQGVVGDVLDDDQAQNLWDGVNS